MKTLVVKLDDELAKELSKHPNMSQVVREALHLYIQHISTDTLGGLRASYAIIGKELKEQTRILNFIAGKVQ